MARKRVKGEPEFLDDELLDLAEAGAKAAGKVGKAGAKAASKAGKAGVKAGKAGAKALQKKLAKKKAALGTETTDIGSEFYETSPSVEGEMLKEASLSGADLLAEGATIGTVINEDEPTIEPVVFAHVQAAAIGSEAATSSYSRIESDVPIGGVYEDDEEDRDSITSVASFTAGTSEIPPMPASVPLVATEFEEEEAPASQDDAAIREASEKALAQSKNFQALFSQFRVGDALNAEFGDDQEFVVFAPSDATYNERMHTAVKSHADPEYGYKYAKHYVCQSADNGGDFDEMPADDQGVKHYLSVNQRQFSMNGANIEGIREDMQVIGQFFHPEHDNVEFIVYNGLHNAVPLAQ